MGQIRHGSATTTHAVRAAIQRSQTSLAALSKEFGINPKTVAKWRKRQTVEDQKTGPKESRSTVLSETDEAMIAAFRRHTLLPLDDWTCRGLVPDHGYLLSDVALMIQRTFPLECGMPPLRVVEIVDVKSDGLLDLLTCAPGLSPHEFCFQGFEEAFRHCIIPAVSLSAHGHEKAMSRKELTVSL